MTSMAASRMRWCLPDAPLAVLGPACGERLGMRNLEFTWIPWVLQPEFEFCQHSGARKPTIVYSGWKWISMSFLSPCNFCLKRIVKEYTSPLAAAGKSFCYRGRRKDCPYLTANHSWGETHEN